MGVFHELHPEPIFCSVEQWRSLQAGVTEGADTLISDLRQRGLLIENPEEDHQEFQRVATKLERKLNQPTILYLMTAQGCNLRCKYCPVPGIARRYGESLLSTEDALAGIDLWEAHLREVYDPLLQYFVIFYGGEPLLNKAVMEASLSYIENEKTAGALPANLNVMIATNGILVDDDIIALCQKHAVMVAVGLDGPRVSNDALKIDQCGAGTFDRIVATIRRLVQCNVRTFASVSITPFNIDHITEYSGFFGELGVEKFGFNFLKGRLLLEVVGRDGLDNYYQRASRGIIENSRRQGARGFEYQMEKKQVAFDTGDFFPVDCTCYGNQLVIQPDGQISNCPFTKAWLGHVRSADANFRIWNQPLVKNWRKRLPLYHSGEAKAVCGGGCAWGSQELKGDPLAVDDSSRIFSEEVLNELIWSQYDRIQSGQT